MSYRRLLRATYKRVTISATYDSGSYVERKQRKGRDRFVVYLDPQARRRGDYASHMTLHELGHVIANEWFDREDYERFFDLFRESPDYQECFETEPGYPIPCDFDTEVLADQIAFYATGNLKIRSPYDIPPLAERPQMAAAIRRAAEDGPASR